jgi:hypothetical protein
LFSGHRLAASCLSNQHCFSSGINYSHYPFFTSNIVIVGLNLDPLHHRLPSRLVFELRLSQTSRIALVKLRIHHNPAYLNMGVNLGLRNHNTNWGTPLSLLIPHSSAVAAGMTAEEASEELGVDTSLEEERKEQKAMENNASCTHDVKAEDDEKSIATESDLQHESEPANRETSAIANPNIEHASSPTVTGPNLDPHLLALEACIHQYRARTRRIQDEYWARLVQLRRQERADRILSLSAAKADHGRATKENEAVDNFEADARKMS